MSETTLNLYEKEDQFRLIIGTDIHIIEEPIGWDGIKILIKRDKDYHGLDFEFTDGDVQLTFTEVSGRSFVNNEYKKSGNDANIILQFGFVVDDVFTSEFEGYLDFNTYKKKDIGIECSVKRKNFNDTLETRFETPVTLVDRTTVDGENMPILTPQILPLHSKELTIRFDSRNSMVNMAGFRFDTDHTSIYIYPDFSSPKNDNIQDRNNPGVGFFQQSPVENGIALFDMKAYGTFLVNINITMKFDFRIHQKAASGRHTRVSFWTLKFLLVVNSTQYVVASQSGSSSSKTVSTILNGSLIDEEIEIKKGDKVYIYGIFQFQTADGAWLASEVKQCFMNTLDISIVGNTNTDQSSANCFLIHDTVDRVLKSITNNQATLKSDLLGRTDLGYPQNGFASMYAISNGYEIRNYRDKENNKKKEVIISMKEILQSLNALFAIGMSVENNEVRIENVEYYYHDVEIISLESVSDYQEEIDTDIIYNEIEIGYKKYPTDEISVMDEFNTKHSYITPIISQKKKLSLLSELIGSGYAIELTRRQQFSTSKEDSWKYDEDNFIISVVGGVQFSFIASFSFGNRIQIKDRKYIPSPGTKIQISGSLYNNKIYTVTSYSRPLIGSYANIYVQESVTEEYGLIVLKELGTYVPEKSEAFTFVEGIIGVDTPYNLRISPKRMLLNHSKWINSGLAYKKGYDIIRNTFTSLNGDLRTMMIGEVESIEEKSNIALNEVGGFEKIFIPEKITFKVSLTYEQIKHIKRCHQNQDTSGKNYGYIKVKDDEGVWKAGYLMSLEYNPVDEMCSITLRKKFEEGSSFNCEDYRNWTFADFEASTGLSPDIEQCKFSDFA